MSLRWSSLALASSASLSALAQMPQETTVAPVVVRGQRVGGDYISDTAGAATRSDVPLRETPQSVRIVPRQLIDDVGAKRLDQTIDYVSGVTRQNSFGGTWDNIAIRGLAGNENTGLGFLVNGFAANRGFNAPRDTANIDRIEVLKGPNSALYGAAEPGGTLNIVTKKPRAVPTHAIGLALDSFDGKRLSVDTTAAISEDVAYRVNMAAEARQTQREHARQSRQLFAPALSWQVGENTALNYEGEYLRQQAPLDRGVVAVNGKVDAMSDKTFLGEPADGDVTLDNQTHQLALEHSHSASWRSRIGLSYKHGTLQGYSTEASALQGDQRTLRRQRRHRDYQSDDTSLQGELIGKLATGNHRHDVVIGFEVYRFELDQTMLRVNPSAGSPYAIDIYRPSYGQPPPTPLPNTSTLEKQAGNAVYMQDQIGISSRWKWLVGLRGDQFLQRIENRRTGTLTRQDQQAFSPRTGVVYLPTEQVSLYGNASTSFRPNSGSDFGGQSFSPERGRSLEAGIKFESRDKRRGATAALFDIRKRNALTADPFNSGFSMATGQVRSRGFELDMAGRIGQHWRVSASYAHLDAEVLRDNTLANGTRLLNIPRNSGSVLAVHEQAIFGSDTLGLGGGVVYGGKRAGDAMASFDLPGYATVKLLGYWTHGRNLRLSLDIDNLLDKKYYASSYNSLWIAPGSRRTVTLGLTASF